jgi:hypothetical protein
MDGWPLLLCIFVSPFAPSSSLLLLLLFHQPCRPWASNLRNSYLRDRSFLRLNPSSILCCARWIRTFSCKTNSFICECAPVPPPPLFSVTALIATLVLSLLPTKMAGARIFRPSLCLVQ